MVSNPLCVVWTQDISALSGQITGPFCVNLAHSLWAGRWVHPVWTGPLCVDCAQSVWTGHILCRISSHLSTLCDMGKPSLCGMGPLCVDRANTLCETGLFSMFDQAHLHSVLTGQLCLERDHSLWAGRRVHPVWTGPLCVDCAQSVWIGTFCVE